MSTPWFSGDASVHQWGACDSSARRPPAAKAFFRSGRAGEWRDRLSEEQVSAVVSANQEQMKRFGYWLDEFDDLVGAPTAAAG